MIMDNKYFSERNLPLVTQHLIDYDDGDIRPMLTVENYEKWYQMYVIHPDGTVEPRFETLTNDGDTTAWIDHAVIPSAFHETAANLGYRYDNKTFAMVCERFVEDILDDDWSKLTKYLPSPAANYRVEFKHDYEFWLGNFREGEEYIFSKSDYEFFKQSVILIEMTSGKAINLEK